MTETPGARRRWPMIVLPALFVASLGLALQAAASVHGLAALEADRAIGSPDAPAKAPDEITPDRLIQSGVDIDGDGKPDFANPTGKPVRACDAYGCGAFGSVRDAGERKHEGVDFDSVAGQAVHAPISGFVSKIGSAYADDEQLEYVEITNPALNFITRIFYIRPLVVEGQAVRVGQKIGRAENLAPRYPGITNHVHVEMARAGRPKFDPTLLILAHRAPIAAPSPTPVIRMARQSRHVHWKHRARHAWG